jgi:hypothetical protein
MSGHQEVSYAVAVKQVLAGIYQKTRLMIRM